LAKSSVDHLFVIFTTSYRTCSEPVAFLRATTSAGFVAYAILCAFPSIDLLCVYTWEGSNANTFLVIDYMDLK
jgi:hypothetical protein